MNTEKFKLPSPAKIRDTKKFIGNVNSREELADTLLKMTPWEYVIVPAGCSLIPGSYKWSERFKKTAEYAKLFTLPRDEAMARRLRPEDSLDTKLAEFKGEERGYGWVGNRNRTLRMVPLVVCYDGLDLMINSDKGDIEVERYGRHAEFSVASRKTDARYEGELLTIPFGDVKDQIRAATKYADWIDLDLRCGCKDEAFMGTLNNYRAIPETRACAHSVAAFKKLKQQQVYKRNPVSIDPFMFPKKAAHDIVQKMRNNVIVVYENSNDENTKRNMLIGEQEAVLATVAAKYSIKPLFMFDNSTRSITECRRYMGR